MSIITTLYFTGKINLPTEAPAQQNKLQGYIDDTQKDYLIKALGYPLYKLFIASLPTPTDQRYLDILNGQEFENTNGDTDKWDGLKDETTYKSMLAYFTYSEYLGSVPIEATGNGTTITLHENSENINPIGKQVEAYNLGIDQYNKLYEFLTANEDTYPEWIFTTIEKTNIFNF